MSVPLSLARSQLLATKLFAPPARPSLVARRRLVARLDAALEPGHKLALVSAPAGFGKTTLISEWCDAHKQRIAWLSLDDADNDLARFLTYFIAALAQFDNALTPLFELLPLSGVNQTLTAEPILAQLINAVLEADVSPRVLVLDDLHVIQNPDIYQALAYWLDHAPPNLLLVATTRADPPLALARWRARDRLTELRAADLRFTVDEAGEFIKNAVGLELSHAQLTALDGRTEGWIAGLQLAALSMRGHADVDHFIQAFTGSHRYVLDYLVEEVLARQSPDLMEFMMQTCILSRLNASLCDAVTGRTDSAARLAQLERENLFVSPLDDSREWFRYHHLFADLLGHRLQEQAPASIASLHGRASDWFAAQGFEREAIQHAFDAHAVERAAVLIQANTESVLKRGEIATLQAWLDKLPPEILRRTPALALARANVLVGEHALDAAQEWVSAAQTALDAAPATDAHARLRGEALVLSAAITHFRNQTQATLEFCNAALAVLPEDSYRLRAQALFYLGITYGMTNQLAASEKAMRQVSHLSQQCGDIQHAVYAEFQVGAIQHSNAQLRRAQETYRAALDMAQANNAGHISTVGWLYCDLGALNYQWNELESAQEYLDLARERGRVSNAPRMLTVAVCYLARLARARHKPDHALQLVAEAQTLIDKHALPARYQVIVLVAQINLWVALGMLEAASQWAEEYVRDHPLEQMLAQPPPYLQEDEYVCVARVWLAQNKPLPALQLLAHAERSARNAQRLGDAISLMPMQVVGHLLANDQRAARALLAEALVLTAPENYIRYFVDEGEPMRTLLLAARQDLSKRAGTDANTAQLAYLNRLVSAFDAPAGPISPAPKPSADGVPPEALTQREFEILQYIAAGLTNADIARALVVETGTVKKHINHMFSKLGVHSRTQALVRAAELGLLN